MNKQHVFDIQKLHGHKRAKKTGTSDAVSMMKRYEVCVFSEMFLFLFSGRTPEGKSSFIGTQQTIG